MQQVLEEIDPAVIGDRVERLGARLAQVPEVSDRSVADVRRIAEDVLVAAGSSLRDRDPYLVVGLQSGAVDALLAAGVRDRSRLRVAIERIRQALRDLREEEPVRDGRPAAEIARWLVETLEVPQAEVARAVGTSPRTFQRWLADDDVEPRAGDLLRLRTLARLAAHLRHGLTGPGVLRWLGAPHPALEGRAPLDLIDEPEGAETLTRLAGSVRSGAAA